MKKRINIIFVGLASFAILSTMIFMSIAFNKLYTQQIMKDLKLMAGFVYDYGLTENMTDVGEALEDRDLRVTLMDPEGNVISDSAADAATMDNHAERPEVIQAMESGEGETVRRSETLDKSTFYYAIRLENGNILRISREADSMYRYIRTIIPSMLVIMILLFAVSMLVAHFLTRKLVKPIEELAENMDGTYKMPYYEELEPFILMIREQHADLLKSARVRQEFTANVTHELKTPLTSISGYAELIETGLASGEDTIRFAGGIRASANRLLTLINDIIRLSELDSEEGTVVMDKLNLYQLASECVEMLQPSAKKHQVTMSISGQDSFIMGNKMMIEELLYNLCDNAIRYNNVNGSVRVDVHEEGSQVILTVSDTGIGIPKESQDRIFERFYRVDKSRSKRTGGTGLGLAIVKHILEKHDAKLKMDSEYGKGTTMMIYMERAA